jgi:hypothetical protein
MTEEMMGKKSVGAPRKMKRVMGWWRYRWP